MIALIAQRSAAITLKFLHGTLKKTDKSVEIYVFLKIVSYLHLCLVYRFMKKTSRHIGGLYTLYRRGYFWGRGVIAVKDKGGQFSQNSERNVSV